MSRLHSVRFALILSGVLGAATATAGSGDTASIAVPLSPRISPSEYRKTIADIFGTDIVINGRFEPEQRQDGLMAVGEESARISPPGMGFYESMARSIAAQVVDPEHRRVLIRCQPHDPKRSDDTCARSFLAATGRFLYRRPMSESELAAGVKVAGAIADQNRDFYAGVSRVLSAMLLSPEFLYQVRSVEPDPAKPGQYRFDSYSRASVLSSFLWGAEPDDTLLKAAERGELLTSEGLRRQVYRMISSPSVEDGVRALFSDTLGFDQFDTLSKDTQFFPLFTPQVIQQAREQTLRTIVNHVVRERRDYRDLFTTPETFLTRSLAAIYDVPLLDPAGERGQPDHWVPYRYATGDPRAGILAQISFVALHSPAGRTSPTDRGKALRELVLCQNVPPPPGNVDFKFVTDTSNPLYKTTRARLTAHRTQPICAGCHKLTDPIGLALENFNSDGSFRSTENGVPIDASGELNGAKFDGPTGLAKAVHDDPATISCVATRSFAYAAGRLPDSHDPAWQQIEKQFKDSGYDVLTLMQDIATSHLLYSVPAQKPAPQTALNTTGGNK
jgi:hypothetical protein